MKTFPVVFGLLLTCAPSWTQQYVISTVAGGAPPTPAAALAAPIGPIGGVAADSAGNVYFTGAQCVFRLAPSGALTRIAGTGRAGYSGDGGPAISAQLSPLARLGSERDMLAGVAVDRAGNLFIADMLNNRVRKVSTGGIITTVAGSGTMGHAGDGGPATEAQLNLPSHVALDVAGNLFIADTANNRVRKVLTSGIITTVAGNGTDGFSGDGGQAASAQLNNPMDVALDGAGNLFIADGYNSRVRKVSSTGIITTVAGNGTYGFSGDGGPATNAALSRPQGLAVDSGGNLFIADSLNARVRKVSVDGTITTVAGNGTFPNPNPSLDNVPATNSPLVPTGVAVDGAGNLFIADHDHFQVRKVSTGGIITTVAGNGDLPPGASGDGGPATSAVVGAYQVAADKAGNLFIGGYGRVRKVSTGGIITAVAGDGTVGSDGDGGPALNARLDAYALAVDGTGNLFVTGDSKIRKISVDGIITTVAGTGVRGFSGDGGPATSAQLDVPQGIAVDGAGNLFIADYLNHRVRKVSTSGIISTVPGTSGLGVPLFIAADEAGNLFVVAGNQVKKVSPDGTITTVAGNGTYGFSGDGGPATNANLDPNSLAVDRAGNLFIADFDTCRLRRVSPDGIINTVAGNGACGFSGDGGPGANAQLNTPTSIAVDGSGNVYVAHPDAVRQLKPMTQSVLISAVVDAASAKADPVTPGKIVVIYGAGLGPSELVMAAPGNGAFGTELAETRVLFNGVAAPVIYTSATQAAAVVPYAISGTTVGVSVTYQGQSADLFSVPVAASAPGLFTSNQTGAGQAASINAVDGTPNTALNPVKIGDYISLYATGEGQTTPAGVDGKLAVPPLPQPNLLVTATVGGIPATVQYRGGAPGFVAGLMQVNVQIPSGVEPGGYVPVVLQVGNASTVNGAVWIAVKGN